MRPPRRRRPTALRTAAARTGPGRRGARSPASSAGDAVRGQRRLQHAVAEVAGGDQQPVGRARADQGRVVGLPGRRPAVASTQLELGDLRDQPVGLAQQLVDPARRHGGVEAALLHRRADDQPAIGAAAPCRRARRRRSARRPARLARPRRVRISPFTGRTGGLASAGIQSRRPDQQPAVRTTARPSKPRPSAVASRQTPPACSADTRPRHRRGRAHRPPIERREQRRHHPARIDAGLARDVRPAADRGRQPRLELPAGPAGQPLGIEAELAVELVAAPEAPRPRRDRARRAARRAAAKPISIPDRDSAAARRIPASGAATRG